MSMSAPHDNRSDTTHTHTTMPAPPCLLPPPHIKQQRHLARLRLPGPKGQRSLSATTFNAGLEPDIQVRFSLS